jgi:hypothetical protein
MNGGASHLDTFDPKPELARRHLKLRPQPEHHTLLPESRNVFEKPVYLQKVWAIGH